MSLTKRTLLLAAASAAALTAGHAAAQDRTVDVITVTAQKREEGIQDVPVAVTAYNEELLTNAGVRDLKDLAVIAPGPQRHLDLERIPDHGPHPRHRYGWRQPRP